MYDMDKAFVSYENALRYNPYNLKALSKVAQICKKREQYTKVFVLEPTFVIETASQANAG